MDIKELMIGDWYKWSADGKDYFYQVKPEDFAKDYVTNFNPIPLTQEILEKNGWYKYYKGFLFVEHEYCWKHDTYFLTLYIKDGEVYRCVFGENILYLIESKSKIKYVHHLQHALRLCNLTELANSFIV